jgi:flagellar FliL protein
MAEKSKKKDEVKEDKDEQETEQEAAPKKGLPVNIIIIGILALCLVGGGLFVWKSGLISKFTGKDGAKTEETEDAEETEGAAGEIGSIYELETFIVNLSGDSGNHYLKVKVSLEMSNAELNLEIEKRLPQFRDSILTLLSSKTMEDVRTLEGKAQIRAEIMTILNQYLKAGRITNVYFGDFIVQ